MGKSFCAYDVTGFLDASIGSYLIDIENCAIEMAHTDDKEYRIALLKDIQYAIRMCNGVLR